MDLDDLLLNPESLSAEKITLLVHRVRTLEIQLASARRKEDELAALVAERNAALDHMQGHVNDLRLQLALSSAGVNYSSSSSAETKPENKNNSTSNDAVAENKNKLLEDEALTNNVSPEMGPDDEKSSGLYQEMCGLCVSGEHAVGNAGRFGRRGSLGKLSSARQNSTSPTTTMTTPPNTNRNNISEDQLPTNSSISLSQQQQQQQMVNNNAGTPLSSPPPPPCSFVSMSSSSKNHHSFSPPLTFSSSASSSPNGTSNNNQDTSAIVVDRTIPKQQQHPNSATVTPTRLRLLQNTRSPKIGAAVTTSQNDNTNQIITNSPFSLSARASGGVLPPTPPSLGGSGRTQNNTSVSSSAAADGSSNSSGNNNNPRLVREYKRLRSEDESNEYS